MDPTSEPPSARRAGRRPFRAAVARLPGLALVLLMFGLLLGPDTAQAQVLVFKEALVVEGGGPRFPLDRPAQRLALPDEWARTRPGHAGPVWYRLEFSDVVPRAAGELLALYAEHVCSSWTVLLNGHLVASIGPPDEPVARNCNQPHLISLPAALFRTGTNVLDIQVAGLPLGFVGSRHRAGALSAVELGPQAVLAARHDRQTAIGVSLPQAVGATLILMGSFMFVLGFINRRESHLAYFGALSIGWAIVDARLWLRELPMSTAVAEFLLCSLLAFVTLAAVQFLLRYARHRNRLVDLALPLQCAAMPLTLIAAGPARLYAVTQFWYAVLVLQVLAAAGFYLHRQWRSRSTSFWLMGALLAAVTVSGGIEFVAQRVGTPSWPAQLAHSITPVLFVLVGLRLVQQHGRALQQAELGKAHLEHRIREATAEIERNFRQIAELKIEQVTERERKRIAADLHDDLGAKLLTIVHTSESERISTLAREALEEMRLSVRGLTGKPVRLADALGDWRAEVVSRLAQAGIEAEWAAPEELPQTLSARAYVQTTRILREATSNIIKHSGASHCGVRCQVADGDFQLVVQDNGEGIAAEPDGRLDRGHGMATMKQRAKQMQGQCLVESGPGYGTVIRLTLPLDRALEGT